MYLQFVRAEAPLKENVEFLQLEKFCQRTIFVQSLTTLSGESLLAFSTP
jgi:hypothetical protein